MGLGERAREWLHRRAAERAEKRAEEQRQRDAEAAEYHRTHLDRQRAAAFLGISIDKLRRMITAGTLPPAIKGPHRQSPPRWLLDDLERFKATMQA